MFVTLHAIERYQQRVENVPAIEVHRRLNAPALRKAAEFGARFVRLSGGQRIVMKDWRIITILPRDHCRGSLSPARDHHHDNEGRDGQG
jgi:hypothetical protein